MYLCRSFMQIRKRRGPSTDPCATPVDISFRVDT